MQLTDMTSNSHTDMSTVSFVLTELTIRDDGGFHSVLSMTSNQLRALFEYVESQIERSKVIPRNGIASRSFINIRISSFIHLSPPAQKAITKTF